MNLKNFDVKQYVNNYVMGDTDDSKLNQEEKDSKLNQEENMERNIRNLLSHFSTTQREEGFSFSKNVLGYFPLEVFNNEDISKFLDHIFSLKTKDDFVGNKTIYNLSNTSIDSLDTKDNTGKRSFEYFYIKTPPESILKDTANGLEYRNRNIIRKDPLKVKLLIENSVSLLDKFSADNNVSNLIYAVKYIDDLFLQIFNYWILSIQGLAIDKKLSSIQRIDAYLQEYKKSVLGLIKNEKLTLNLEDTVSIFVSILTKRNEYGEYISIVKTLDEEQMQEPELFNDPMEKYKVEKKDKLSEDKLKNKDIITEGIHVDQYSDKLKKVKEMIRIFSTYGGRTADEDSIFDIKAYFREIYLSHSKYKRQAQTIVRKYMDKCQEKRKSGCRLEEIIKSFAKESEYQFLREKISRGNFRETYDIQLYHKKNKLQKELYETLINTLLLYNYKESISLLKKLTKELIPICFKDIDDSFKSNYGCKIFQ